MSHEFCEIVELSENPKLLSLVMYQYAPLIKVGLFKDVCVKMDWQSPQETSNITSDDTELPPTHKIELNLQFDSIELNSVNVVA